MELSATRREMLTWMFGLPAAGMLGSCRRTTTPTFDGGFHDPPFAAGHRLRDGHLPPAPSEAVEVPVLILGAGLAGLTAAWRLVRSGFDRFQILDLESAPGGTARGDRSTVTEYPWGAHYLPTPTTENPNLVELCEELGFIERYAGDQPVFREQYLVADPEERVFFEGTWHRGLLPRHAATAEDRRQLERFEMTVAKLSDPRADGSRAFTLPVDQSAQTSNLGDLDTQTFGEWLKRERFDAPMVRYLADYACRDDYGTDLDHTSAWYGLHYFAARRSGSKSESAPFLSWPGGNKHIADRMMQRIGFEKFRPFTVAASVSPHGDGRRARVRSWDLRRGQSMDWIAERVIFALPSYLRRYLIRGYEAAAYHPTYAPWVVTNVHLSGRPASSGFEASWDNTIYDSRSLGYVVATHQSGPAHGPTVWTHYTPLTGDPRTERNDLLSLSWADASDAVVRELARVHVDFERYVDRIDVRRWGHGMVRPIPGTKTDAGRRRAANPCGPIHFAHTDLSGAALFEEAYFHGDRAAREVLTSLKGSSK